MDKFWKNEVQGKGISWNRDLAIEVSVRQHLQPKPQSLKTYIRHFPHLLPTYALPTPYLSRMKPYKLLC